MRIIFINIAIIINYNRKGGDNMQEKLKLLLEQAIAEEEYFHNFYTELAKKAEDEDLKNELLKLAEFEMLHKEKHFFSPPCPFQNFRKG